jgi:prepilin-type N-terminal cleavage/methylation domain-containing protein
LAIPIRRASASLRRRLRPAVCVTRRAFTLIELILAIGIMATVMIAINAVFFSALRLHDSTTNAVDSALPIERTLDTLRRDLQGAMPPSVDGILSGDFKVGNASVMTTGSTLPVDIEMYTTTGALRENEPWGEVQRVTYSLRMAENRNAVGKDLYRSVTRNLLATVPPQPDDQWMMGGVDSIEFACNDGTSWIDYWDSTLTTNLPTSVRVRILLANPANNGGTPRPIEMIVPIDTQSTTNQGI